MFCVLKLILRFFFRFLVREFVYDEQALEALGKKKSQNWNLTRKNNLQVSIINFPLLIQTVILNLLFCVVNWLILVQ